MNWKLRLQNKTTLTTLILAALSLVYQVLAALGVTPSVSQEQAVNVALMIVNALCLLGIVVDPTSDGITDSKRAMGYDKPNDDKEG